MIKMLIQMDEKKIIRESEYTLEQIYETLDKVFGEMGYSCVRKSKVREYCGSDNPRDFGRFGRIYNTLKRQPWFMNNASVWQLCNSDDSDDPNDFSVEDLLVYNHDRILASA